jgi:hypothetical protein
VGTLNGYFRNVFASQNQCSMLNIRLR